MCHKYPGAGHWGLLDNDLVHTSRVAQVAICECKFEQLTSPDLVQSDYYLFGNLKSHLHEIRFQGR